MVLKLKVMVPLGRGVRKVTGMEHHESFCCFWCSVSWSEFYFVKIHLAVNLGSMCLSVCVFCLYEIFILKKQHMGKYMWVQSTEVWQSEFWDQADKEGLVEEGKFWDSAEKCGWLNGDRNKCVIY